MRYYGYGKILLKNNFLNIMEGEEETEGVAVLIATCRSSAVGENEGTVNWLHVK
jgi:hypothetical protein